MSQALTRETFLAPKAPEVFRVDLPSKDGYVFVRLPTPRQFEDFETHSRKLKEAGNGGVGLRARVAILCCCNEDGTPLFTTADEGPLSVDPSGLPALDAIFAFVAPKLGWVDSAVEDRAKNSPTTTGGDSTTD